MTWKYVTLRMRIQKIPIIFPGSIPHSVMADLLGDALFKNLDPKMKIAFDPEVFSAGFLKDLKVEQAYGHSSTLKVSSDPDDAPMINSYPYLHGL